MNLAVKRTRRSQNRVELSGRDIIELLRQCGAVAGLPDHNGINVRFNVPSGGDYSGMRVEIDEYNPVTIDWESVEEDTVPCAECGGFGWLGPTDALASPTPCRNCNPNGRNAP